VKDVKDYTKEIEDLFIQFLISDPELFIRCKSITSPEYFSDHENREVISFFESHSNSYSILPTVEQVRAVTGKKIEKIQDVAENHQDWFLGEYESFCRHKALEIAILKSPDLLLEGRYGEVETSIKRAVEIGLVKDLGTDYYHDPKGRLEAVRDNSGLISTGWRDVDRKLYGGFNRGEITIFAGQPGAGKSLFLQNLGVNWAEAGLNVLYITLELSEKLTGMRLDAMVSGYETKEILKNIDDVAMRVKANQKKNKGSLRLKYMASGSTSNDIRAYVKEYEVQTGIKVDGILVDYLDLCGTATVKVSASDQFIKDKYVSEDLRNMAADLDVLFATASQLNRGSYEEIDFDPSHIAGGISKVNTADNVIGIFVTNTMKESGRYQIQFLKTRSSSGVGSKVDLAFSPKTLRIRDLEEGEMDASSMETSNILNNLKARNIVKEKDVTNMPTNNIKEKTAAVRSLLKRID